MYALSDYHYHLPPELIAQKPVEKRDQSRLLVLDRTNGHMSHQHFYDLPEWLKPGDLLVVNNTQVMPVRLYGRKESGGKIELLLLDPADALKNASGNCLTCRCLVKASKPSRPGTAIILNQNVTATVIDGQDGIYTLDFTFPHKIEAVLSQIGHMPLPPYIHRNNDSPNPEDSARYQTVYAKQPGAIAAPTAGLHFTPQLFSRLEDQGIETIHLTLHVGYGTFVPIRCDDIRQHQMHSEEVVISPDAAQRINGAKKEGRRVIAVGTTSVRSLEWAANDQGAVTHRSGSCDIFIYPGFQFQVVDALITNFHLPESTLMMLVSAFADRTQILQTYQQAVDQKYRFFSYGDAMLIV